MAGTSKVDLFAAIHRDARVEQLSIRASANKYNVHRRTVREALESPVAPAAQEADALWKGRTYP